MEKERERADVAALREALGELAPVVRSVIVILSGLPGTGKSYFCSRLAQKKTFIILESDRLRKVLCKKPDYSSAESVRLFLAIHRLLEQLLMEKMAVILDATNLNERHRQHLYDIAERSKARLVLVEVKAPPQLVKERMAKRSLAEESASDANWEVYRKMESQRQVIKREHYCVDTSKDEEIDEIIEKMIKEVNQPF